MHYPKKYIPFSLAYYISSYSIIYFKCEVISTPHKTNFRDYKSKKIIEFLHKNYFSNFEAHPCFKESKLLTISSSTC